MQTDRETLKHASELWHFLRLGQPLQRSDCIIAMGSHDLRVGEHAARLILDGWAPLLVCSGGLGRLTRAVWNEAEARQFARIARQMGVPASQIVIEDQSTNTGQNIQFSRCLLQEKGYAVRSAILVHKPYMERRALATALKIWPEIGYSVSSPPIGFEDYPTDEIPMAQLLHIMVGDFQRILVYPEAGFQVTQELPAEALLAYQSLIECGFTKSLVKEKQGK